jgi:hypothetical protein
MEVGVGRAGQGRATQKVGATNITLGDRVKVLVARPALVDRGKVVVKYFLGLDVLILPRFAITTVVETCTKVWMDRRI